jgi:hypothetical protein
VDGASSVRAAGTGGWRLAAQSLGSSSANGGRELEVCATAGGRHADGRGGEAGDGNSAE